ncbi:MAG: hypothetical protein EON54_19750 [Alcaligenaceae bacterium]|nr:MAG: hypothetical protein EON54_19750 [Alcaligenaceae bacterium]
MKRHLASSEFRAVFDVARRYLAGASSVHELNGAVSNAQTWAKGADTSPALREVLDDWSRMVNRRWNEWGLEKSPLSEAEFQEWLRQQLVSAGHEV